ncbi:LPS translocon maturation chaperone LptM [Hylemonella sp. W303a]|uniref:LPS translocon maturation chaperone LptM n=1 Tax=Hylemonella sp. W303a TaxID=3389873 RepID=UPI00396B1677
MVHEFQVSHNFAMLETRAIARSIVRACAILVSPLTAARRRAFAPAVLAVIGVSGSLLLSGCGQTGKLYLPKDPAAAHRASLPRSLWPFMPSKNPDEAQDQASQDPAAQDPEYDDPYALPEEQP